MFHSHEALDPAVAAGRGRMRDLFRHRDFRLLWGGMCVSLLGDGAFLIAIAWQVYALSDAPTALSVVGIAMTLPTILFLLLGGVISDRVDRRLVMLGADAIRGLSVALLAALSFTDALALWHIVVLVAVYGTGQAFFAPAFDAIVPDVLPDDQLARANALDQLVRPLALRMAGPAVGGALVDVGGTGAVFALDAVTFACSAAAVLAMRARARPARGERAAIGADLMEGLRYVRSHVWLWGTFACAALAYLVFMGPAEVLLPYMVKDELSGSGTQLGIVLGAGGLGSVACAVILGRAALPRRHITFMYLAWTAATVAIAGYGLATAVWQLMLASLAFNALETAGTIVWATAKQRHVPRQLLGRVSSLDWLISIGLVPISFALTGPVSAAVGVRSTLVAAGVIGGAVTLAGLLLPGMRALEEPAHSPGAGARKRVWGTPGTTEAPPTAARATGTGPSRRPWVARGRSL